MTWPSNIVSLIPPRNIFYVRPPYLYLGEVRVRELSPLADCCSPPCTEEETDWLTGQFLQFLWGHTNTNTSWSQLPSQSPLSAGERRGERRPACHHSHAGQIWESSRSSSLFYSGFSLHSSVITALFERKLFFPPINSIIFSKTTQKSETLSWNENPSHNFILKNAAVENKWFIIIIILLLLSYPHLSTTDNLWSLRLKLFHCWSTIKIFSDFWEMKMRNKFEGRKMIVTGTGVVIVVIGS